MDLSDAQLQEKCGLSVRWYDVLVHLEEPQEGLPMNELAAQIISSKSGLTRVVDRMEESGLVRRERPPGDRRVIRVLITPEGIATLAAARKAHHETIQEHFLDHISDKDLAGIARALTPVSKHLQLMRPGRVAAAQPADSRDAAS